MTVQPGVYGTIKAQYGSLEAFASGHPQDAGYIQTVRDCGTEILEQAGDVLFKSDRTAEEAAATLKGLSDLERAARVTVDTTRTAQGDMTEKLNQALALAPRPAHVEAITATDRAQVPGTSPSPFSDPNHAGKRIWGAETAQLYKPAEDTQAGLGAFIHDVHDFGNLFAAFMTTPPPQVAAEIFTSQVADVTVTGSGHQSDSAQTSQTSPVFLGLGHKTTSTTADRSRVSNTIETLHAEVSQSDKRLQALGIIRDLTERLHEMKVKNLTHATINATGQIREVEVKPAGRLSSERDLPHVWWLNDKQGSYFTVANMTRQAAVVDFQPQHVWMPVDSTSEY